MCLSSRNLFCLTVYLCVCVSLSLCANVCVYIFLSIYPSRCTSRPKALGSGVEAIFRFLGSGVDF